MKKHGAPLLAWLLFALWAGVIFYFSAQPDVVSGEQSGFFADLLQQVVHAVSGQPDTAEAGEALYALLDHIVRKGAHFAVYAVLGVLCARAYAACGVRGGGMRFLLCVLTCALYAATDELHQHFVPGRFMAVSDVMLDSAGAACGALLLQFMQKAGFFQNHKKK